MEERRWKVQEWAQVSGDIRPGHNSFPSFAVPVASSDVLSQGPAPFINVLSEIALSLILVKAIFYLPSNHQLYTPGKGKKYTVDTSPVLFILVGSHLRSPILVGLRRE